MTTTLQDRFFTTLDTKLAEHHAEAIIQRNYPNTGRVHVVPEGSFDELLSFSYHFQEGHNVFESDANVWPDGAKNPRMFIARSAADVGKCLAQITDYVAQA